MDKLNDFIVADGEEAKNMSEQSDAPQSKLKYLKLKAGESVRVMLLDPNIITYYCHGDFSLKIPSHVCTAPKAGMSCKSCDAGIHRSLNYLVVLYDVDKKEIVLFDTKKKHVSGIYSNIEAYGKEDVTGEIFTMKRTGSTAQDTSYSFVALPPKQKATVEIPTDVKPFVEKSQERADFYASIVRAPGEEYQNKILAQVAGTKAGAAGESDEVTPVSDGATPF